MNSVNKFGEVCRAIAKAIRVVQVGGRRVQCLELEARYNWIDVAHGLNRHERRRYLSNLRKTKPEV